MFLNSLISCSFTLVAAGEDKNNSPNLTNSQEPELEPHVFGPMEQEPLEIKIPGSGAGAALEKSQGPERSHLEKKSGAGAAKKLPGS